MKLPQDTQVCLVKGQQPERLDKQRPTCPELCEQKLRAIFMSRYYLKGSDAFRLKLMLPLHPERLQALKDEEIAAEQLKQLSISPTGNGL